jgi:hypothetical protein
MTMRDPEQIIGKDALLQLTFEGYAVVPRRAVERAYDGLLNGHLNDETEQGFITAEVGTALKAVDETAWRRVAFGDGEPTEPEPERAWRPPDFLDQVG